MTKAPRKNDFLVRTEPVRQLERSLRGLFDAAAASGQAVGKDTPIRQALTARCLKCEMEVSGSELFIFAHPAGEEEGNRVRRMRQNRCVRQGCEFNLYEVRFQKHAEVDWDKLFSLAKSTDPEVETKEAEVAVAVEEPAPLLPPVRLRPEMYRTGAMVAALLLLLFLRQVYVGGRIPLLREPQKFKVSVAADQKEDSDTAKIDAGE